MSRRISATARHSLRDLAARAEVHRNTVDNWIKNGVSGQRLTAVRIGAQTFVTERDWLDFLRRLNHREVTL